MKVIKINKNVHGRIKKNYLFLDDDISDDEIEGEVLDWCENEPSGQNGYSYEWWCLIDEVEIADALEKEISIVDSNILSYHIRRDKLAFQLHLIKKT